MEHLNRAIVVYDMDKTEHLALQRSLDLAKSFDMEIYLFTRVFHYSYDMSGYLSDEERKRIKRKLVKQANDKLIPLVDELSKRGLRVSHYVGWGNSLTKALSEVIEDIKPDLVIKAYEKNDSSLADIIFTPTDWAILRESGVDILMVKEAFWPQETHVLATLDVMAEDEVHQALNRAVLKTAKALADMCGVELHVCHVYPYPLVDVPIAYSSVDFEHVSNELEKASRTRLQEITANMGIENVHLHAVQGLVEEQVTELAKKIKADLIVIGTAGRKGLSAAFMGNTAEQILDSINSDVWAVKPS